MFVMNARFYYSSMSSSCIVLYYIYTLHVIWHSFYHCQPQICNNTSKFWWKVELKYVIRGPATLQTIQFLPTVPSDARGMSTHIYIRWPIFLFHLHRLSMVNPKSKTRTKSTPKKQSKTKLPRETVTKSFNNGASQITLDIPAIREYEM